MIGRIKFLTNSIRTIKFIRGVGVPVGTIWIIMFFVLDNHPINIIVSHIIIAVEKDTEMWAVGVKINGNRARKFIRRITVNNDFININLPFFLLLEKRFSISLLIFEFKEFKVFIHVIFILNLDKLINIIGNKIDNQDILIKCEEGSKIENKLFIMFS